MSTTIETISEGGACFRLGDRLVEPRLNRVTRDGEAIQIEIKAMDVLLCLVRRAGEVVTRQEIVDAVWATEFISDNTLTHAIAELRNALGDDARTPSFIETIHRRGYRLITPVEPAGPEEPTTGTVARFPVSKTLADDARNPYPGLAAFTESDAELFFGREAEVAALWRKLTTRRLLAVIGPSGVGKSSLLRAGLIPAAPEGWDVRICQPGEAPFSALARALAPDFSDDPGALAALFELASNDTGFAVISRWRRRHDQALLIVDQLEELFTQSPLEVQTRFAEVLGRLAREADIHVLLAMRDDFVYRCHEHPALAPVFADLTPIAQPAPEALARALALPARRCGYSFDDDDLVGRMVAEVAEERAALPLLAFTAARLWEERDRENRLLTRQAYEDIGGIHGALAGHAEATVAAIGAGRLPVVREIFRNLVTAEGTRATREVDDLLSVFESEEVRRSALPPVASEGLGVGRLTLNSSRSERLPLTPHSERSERSPLDSSPSRAAAAEVLAALIDARLLTSYEVTTEDGATHRTVEIVHESLLAAWPRLVRWQAQDAEGALLRDQLRQAARIWNEHDRSDDLLWTGSAFREFAVWRERYPGGLSELEEAFAVAMTSLATRRRRRRRIAVAAGFAILFAVLAVVGTLWRRSVQETRRAEAEIAHREAAQLLALGRLRLADSPNRALAFAIASLERADNDPARRFAVEALAQGPPALYLEAPANRDSVVRWSPDGRWLAYGGDGEVKLLERGQSEVRSLSLAFPDEIPKGFTSDGQWLVSERVGAGNVLNVWSLPEGRLEHTLESGDNTRVWLVGDRLLTLSFDTPGPRGERAIPVRLLSLDGTTEQELGVWRPNGLLGVEVDPTGTWLVALQGGRILQQRLDALEAPPRDLGTYAGEVSLRVGPWRDRAVLRDASGEVRVWDLPSGRLLHAVKSPAGVRTLALHPEGRFLATGPWLWLPPRSMFLFDLSAPAAAEPTPLLQIPVNVLLGMTFSPDGVWLTSEHRRVALLWNTSGRHPVVLGRGERPVVCFDEDGHLLTGGNEGVLRRWFLDPGAAEAVEELWSRPDSQITWLEPAPGGRSVAVRDGSGYTRVVIVPLDGSGTTITEPERPPEPPEAYLNASDLAWHPSGGSFAVFEVSWVRPDLNGIRVLDLATGIRRTLDTHVVDGGGCDDGDLQLGRASPVWLPDGRLLSDGVAGLRLWDLETGTSRLLQPCRRTEWHIRLLATPDSRALVRLDLPSEMAMPSSLSVRDLGSGETREIISHGNHVTDAALDPSGTILATGDASGVIRVGRLTGEEPHLLFGHTGTVLRVAVSPDGSRIASGSADGTIRLWPMPDLSKPPLHTLPHDELLAKLHSLTNLRAVPDPDSDTGWTIEIGPFPGWREVPTW